MGKSRAEQLLAALDCHVTIDQRADAIKAIEAYLVDAYEAGWYYGGGPVPLNNSDRRAAVEYASDPEQP